MSSDKKYKHCSSNIVDAIRKGIGWKCCLIMHFISVSFQEMFKPVFNTHVEWGSTRNIKCTF